MSDQNFQTENLSHANFIFIYGSGMREYLQSLWRPALPNRPEIEKETNQSTNVVRRRALARRLNIGSTNLRCIYLAFPLSLSPPPVEFTKPLQTTNTTITLSTMIIATTWMTQNLPTQITG